MPAATKASDAKRRRKALEAVVFGAGGHDGTDDDSEVYDSEDDGTSRNNINNVQTSGQTRSVVGTSQHLVERSILGEQARNACVWNDSDEENLEVQITTGKKRLRKLRKAAEETRLSGKDYEQRLREQFLKQQRQTVPSWAKPKEAEEDEDEEVHDSKTSAGADSDLDDQEDETAEVQHEIDLDRCVAQKKYGLFASKADQKKNKSNHAKAIKTAKNLADEKEQKTSITASAADQFKNKPLPPPSVGLFMTTRPNLNAASQMNCVAECVKFHPNSEIVATAGKDKMLKLFAINADPHAEHPLLASYHFEKYPITGMAMQNKYGTTSGEDATTIFLCGKTHELKQYDIATGKVSTFCPFRGTNSRAKNDIGTLWDFQIADFGPSSSSQGDQNLASVLSENGKLCVIDTRIATTVKQFQMNSAAQCHVRLPTGKGTAAAAQFLSCDATGRMYEWDLRSGRCLHNFQHDNCIGISSIDVSAEGTQIAIGTTSGTVDVLERNYSAQPLSSSGDHGGVDGGQERYVLKKTYDQLQHEISTVRFHKHFRNPAKNAAEPSSELLSFASKYTRKGLKMAHLQSHTVYEQSWNTFPLKYVQSIEFSNKNGYCALGQSDGKVLLFQIDHFGVNS
ncbi:unnamed protein product [Amoebophrya sp. A120]|nr:unnamed protein product [Amoebophrya sp. A120]|eukprot:GSA120T00006437001.1